MTYEELLHLEHPTSKKHKRMSAENRAAQFAPFAALTGYQQAIKQTEQEVVDSLPKDFYTIDTE